MQRKKTAEAAVISERAKRTEEERLAKKEEVDEMRAKSEAKATTERAKSARDQVMSLRSKSPASSRYSNIARGRSQ